MKRVSFANVRTNVFGLPALAAPQLSRTVDKYSTSVKPMKKGPAVETHFERLSKFVNGSSKELQLTLENITKPVNGCTSHLSWGTWRDDEVLRQRRPLPVNSSVALGFKKFGAIDATAFDSHVVLKPISQVQLAANIIFSVAKFVRGSVQEGLLMQEGCDASNMADLFCSARVPSAIRDEISRSDWGKAEHVAVLRDGHVYFIRVFSAQTQLVTDVASIQAAIELILKVTPLSDNSAPVSALTSLGRDEAASAFTQLVSESPQNASALEAVQNAITVICLDTEAWPTPEVKQKYMLFGGVAEAESRWYHKNQIIISADGEAALNYDRALTDRHAAVAWCNTMFEDVQHALLSDFPEKSKFNCLPPVKTVAVPADELVQPMKVIFGKSFANNIRSAKESAKKLGERVCVDYVRIPTVTLGLHADAFMQICFQLAYFMLHGRLAPTSQEISLSKFYNGGMAYLRTGTAVVQPFLELWAQREKDPTSVDRASIVKALNDINGHYLARLAEVGEGEGVDEHLHALEYVATVTEARNPKFADAREFFSDPLFKAWDTPVLASGSISAPFIDCYSIGPQTPDGFGLGYVIQPSYVLVSITSFHEDKISEFRDGVTKASKALREILKD